MVKSRYLIVNCKGIFMNKKITKEQVEHLAWLARLELSEDEKKLYTNQLNEILEYFSRLDELDTEKVDPTYQVIGKINVFREDEVKLSLSIDEVLQNAPRKEKRFFKAPRIM